MASLVFKHNSYSLYLFTNSYMIFHVWDQAYNKVERTLDDFYETPTLSYTDTILHFAINYLTLTSDFSTLMWT
jgi:hypothetical protein